MTSLSICGHPWPTARRPTTSSRIGLAAAILAFAATGCGGDPGVDAAVDLGPTATTVAAAAELATAEPSTAASTPTAPSTVTGSPSVAALTSGRGDDGSLEIGIWFAADPFRDGGASLLVGTDADESYPGVGDPRPHIDGWVEITDSGVVLVDDGATVVDSATGDVSDWFSWTGPDRVIWIYFIGNVPVRAGTVWVALEVDGDVGAAGLAGAPFGSGCSYREAGVDVDPVGGDIPDFGAPCRYPLG